MLETRLPASELMHELAPLIELPGGTIPFARVTTDGAPWGLAAGGVESAP